MKPILSTCTFSMPDQQRFAELSGDRNPAHLDATFARRTLFGRPVVHPVHLLLHALDRWLELRPPTLAAGRPLALRQLRGRFPNPAYVNEGVEFQLHDQQPGRVGIQAVSQEMPVLSLALRWDQEGAPGLRPLPGAADHARARLSAVLELGELPGRSGTLPLWGDLVAMSCEFPSLLRHAGSRQVAELLACSRLVGMECPGLHSHLCRLDLERCEPELAHDHLDYCVGDVEEGSGLVPMDVASSGFQGRIGAYRFPDAAALPSFAEVAGCLKPCEFEDQVALVVGGSRGIGAVTAKLIAAGGGRVVATYRSGEGDALETARDIRSGGGHCEVVHCDAERPGKAFEWLDSVGIVPTHLYYFASPRVFQKRGRAYSAELYQRFASIYVDGFEAVLLACRERRPEGLTVFYPSSRALDGDTALLAEYRDAKRAGEQLCVDLHRVEPPLGVHVARLPRVATDRTLAGSPGPLASPLTVMLDALRTLAREAEHG